MSLATPEDVREVGAPVALQLARQRAGARLPRRQTALASGFDLYACLDELLELGELPVKVPTGIAIAVPPGTDVQIRPRSGLSAKGVMAAFGTIDADYRGELLVTMYRLPGTPPFVVHDGDRIAQLVVALLAPVECIEVAHLDDTERGNSGHGSTGLR